MPVTRETLRLVRDLRVTVGTEADDAVRDLTKRWVQAWDDLAVAVNAGITDLVAKQATLGRAPRAWELARIDRLRRALQYVEVSLIRLASETGSTVTDAAGRAITATARAEPGVIASQLPASEQAAAAVSFDRVPAGAIDAIVRRVQQRIVSTSMPLSTAAYQAVRRELVRGVAGGLSPDATARAMLDRVRGAFDGGLVRATVISRTETLDAYRLASRASHMANSDMVRGWVWTCSLDRRTCFPAGTTVATSRGSVPIEAVRVGDQVVTHAGNFRRVAETLDQQYSGDFVSLEAGALRVAATADHPFLVERQGQLRWMEARWVRVGDAVFSDRQCVSHCGHHSVGEVAIERRCDEANDLEALPFEDASLPGVTIGDPVVPEGFVDFDHDRLITQKEVDGALPARHGGFLREPDPEGFERKPDVTFGNRFSHVSSVTAHRTEAATVGRDDPLPLAAGCASDFNGWSAASLRTMSPLIAVDCEGFPASLTLDVLSRGSRALNRTVEEAHVIAGRDRENLAACDALLGHAPGVVKALPRAMGLWVDGAGLEGDSTLRACSVDRGLSDDAPAAVGLHARVPAIAGSATKLPATSADLPRRHTEALATRHADKLLSGGLVTSSLQSGSASLGAELSLSTASLEGNPTMLARSFHRHIVSNTTVTIRAERVFNLEVEDDHSYVANGFVVHNCPSCWSRHGSEHSVDEIGPNDHQQGRCARTPLVKSWRDLGFTIDEPASQFPDARKTFDRLPKADQLQIMGPERLELLRTGRVDWSDLSTERTNSGWRTSFVPTSVADLRRNAA